MAVCCKYQEQDGSIAVACYENRDACPDLPSLTLIDDKQVDACPETVIDCFADADNEDVRVLQR
jgi:hypothetical protein